MKVVREEVELRHHSSMRQNEKILENLSKIEGVPEIYIDLLRRNFMTQLRQRLWYREVHDERLELLLKSHETAYTLAMELERHVGLASLSDEVKELIETTWQIEIWPKS